MEASGIDWETINSQLPYDHSEEAHAQRRYTTISTNCLAISNFREIWNTMNLNGNKYLFLAEVDKGVIDVISIQYII